MKSFRILIGTLLGILFLMSCSSGSKNPSYTITGQIKGLSDGVHVQLIPVSHDKEKPLCDTTVVDGKFVFKGNIEEPRAMMLVVKGAYGYLPLMLENTDMRIEGEVSMDGSKDSKVYDFAGVTVKGSPLTDHYNQLLSVRDTLDEMYRKKNEQFGHIMAVHQKAYMEKNQARLDSIVKTDEFKAMKQADSIFFETVKSKYQRVILDNRDSFWGPLMMISLMSYFDKEQEAWYYAFSKDVKESYYGRKVKDELFPVGKEGTKVENFTVKNSKGEAVTLFDLCKGKKYILIDFWASWCNPCRKEIPNLKKLYAAYSGKGFQIVSVSIDTDSAAWEKALKEEKLEWPNFLDTEGVATLYNVKFVPTMYLIDANGIILAENLRGEQLAAKIAELYGEQK